MLIPDWVTSDWHLWHTNIIEYCGRPFASIKDMHRALLENFNSVVGPDDTTVFLGDFALRTDTRTVKAFLGKLNGTKILVWGNHDKGPSWCLDAGWDMISNGFTVSDVVLSHHPPKHLPTHKYRERQPVLEPGQVALHGHRHSAPGDRLRDRALDVGVDAWNFSPVRFEIACHLARKGV